MADVHDVAAAIVEKHGPMTAMKLQKLVYYSQAWHLVWEEEPLFGNEVEAWANGPVVRELYNRHRGQFRVQDWRHGDKRRLNRRELSTIRAVLDFYGEKSAAWLSELSHREDPWRDARAAAGLEAGERGNATIPLGSMAEYYSGLVGATDA